MRCLNTCVFLLSVLSLPVTETYFLRQMVHFVLGPNVCSLGIYARDIYVPFLAGLVWSLAYLRQQNGLEFGFRPLIALLNILIFASLGFQLLYYDTVVIRIGAAATVLLLMFQALLMVTSAICVFTSGRALLQGMRQHQGLLLLPVLASGLLFAYPSLLARAWPHLVYATGHSVYNALRFLGHDVQSISINHSIGIIHPSLRISIGMGCSGLEGIFYFLFAYLLFLFASPTRNSFKGIFLVPVYGTLFMFALNVIRIVLFFSVALLINRFIGYREGRGFFVWAFHQNVGWILYFLGMSAFFSVLAYGFPRWARQGVLG